MTIKYAARGISTQMRTAEELLFTDGVTLKPINGGDVFVEDDNNERILVGTSYNVSTGGCTVNGVVYQSGSDLNGSALYVVPSTLSAYNLLIETLVGIGYNGIMYLTPTCYWIYYSDLIAEDLYLTNIVPTQTPVWKISDGTVGTRYTGSEGDAVVKDANGNYYYYNTVSECDAVWFATVPLCFTAEQAGSSVKLGKSGSGTTGFTYSYRYSMDNVHWNDYIIGSVITLTNVGDKVYFKGSRSDQSSSNYMQFEMTGRISASGSVNSMLSENFEQVTDLTAFGDYAFTNLFSGCTSLVQAPELPSATLAERCYYNMFSGCTSLTSAPELPATTLATECYELMFSGCTTLVQAPELPATTLAPHCYSNMFFGCTSLVQAPELPATTLATCCYYRMFYGCTSLTSAPELPATTLATECYELMFSGCTLLNEVRCYATDISASYATINWLAGVSLTGTFYKVANVEWPSGVSGIPSGWSVVEMEGPSQALGYSTYGSSQKTTNAQVYTNAGMVLYAPNASSDTEKIHVSYTKYYEIISIKNAAGTSLSVDTRMLYTDRDGNLKLYNGTNNNLVFCSVEYRETSDIYVCAFRNGEVSDTTLPNGSLRFLYDMHKVDFRFAGLDRVQYTIQKAWLVDGTEVVVPSGVTTGVYSGTGEQTLIIRNNSGSPFTYYKLLLRAEAGT